MNKSSLRTIMSSTALIWAVTASSAMAQGAAGAANATDGASADQLTDIVVTARKVEENIQRVPIAVTAFSGAELQKQSVRTLPEAATLTPGLVIASGLTNAAAVLIMMRGQIQEDTLATLDPSVGTYVDGIYWARAYGLNATLVDVANFQALKGPQGTLFGRNTTGGAILVNTNDPSFADGLSGSLSGTYGRFNQQSLTAILNVPLVDERVAARIVYSGNRRDPYVKEVNSGRMIADLNDYTIRGKLLITPIDDFRLLLAGEKFHSKTFEQMGRLGYGYPNSLASWEAGIERLGAAPCVDQNFAPTPTCLAAGNALLARDVGLSKSQFNATLSSIPQTVLTTQTYSATATLDTSFGSIKAIGGYRKLDFTGNDTDSDAATVRLLDSSGLQHIQKIQQWSGELTVTGKALENRLDFALGAFWFHEYGNDDTGSSYTRAISVLFSGGLRPWTSFLGHVDNKSIGFYGQTSFHISDQLALTTGLRWSQDKRSVVSNGGVYLIDNVTGAFNSFICAFPAQGGCPYSRGSKSNGLAYTVSLDYQATDNILAYLKTAKGFRSGGEGLRGVGAVPASLKPFKPEIVYSYEGGLKSELFDRRLRINGAIYFTNTKDAQRNTTVVNGLAVSATLTENAGSVHTYGGEVEMTAILGGGFRISGSAAYTKPKYVKFIDANGFDRSHEPFQLVPRWTATISPEWSGNIGDKKLNLRADFAYQSSQTLYPTGFYQDAAGVWHDATTGLVYSAADVAGTNAANTGKAHILVNASGTLTLLEDKLDVTVWGKNLTNLGDYVNALAIPQLGFVRSVLREPRTYGVTATVRF